MTHVEIIKANLGAELGRRGLLQKDAAEALGLTKAGFSAKLHGRTAFKVMELLRLAAWLRVPFSHLVEGLDEADELSNGGVEVVTST
ncbi:hypothetical protein [Nesterenkonia marinintestina]|uniref:hypothetical protein n=1 Tax=Nesterenkonia marinintestina TaxID=2979865 RepID=UPI0021BFAFB6|nr:hypothetical protein [Nesterenkonia sp. GX14115]